MRNLSLKWACMCQSISSRSDAYSLTPLITQSTRTYASFVNTIKHWHVKSTHECLISQLNFIVCVRERERISAGEGWEGEARRRRPRLASPKQTEAPQVACGWETGLRITISEQLTNSQSIYTHRDEESALQNQQAAAGAAAKVLHRQLRKLSHTHKQFASICTWIQVSSVFCVWPCETVPLSQSASSCNADASRHIWHDRMMMMMLMMITISDSNFSAHCLLTNGDCHWIMQFLSHSLVSLISGASVHNLLAHDCIYISKVRHTLPVGNEQVICPLTGRRRGFEVGNN